MVATCCCVACCTPTASLLRRPSAPPLLSHTHLCSHQGHHNRNPGPGGHGGVTSFFCPKEILLQHFKRVRWTQFTVEHLFRTCFSLVPWAMPQEQTKDIRSPSTPPAHCCHNRPRPPPPLAKARPCQRWQCRGGRKKALAGLRPGRG